jgi:hypothetical protein
MIEIICKVENGHLVGASALDAETLAAQEGESFTVRMTQGGRKRSMSQLALYWVVCGIIADNFESEHAELTKEDVDRVLKVGAGHRRIILLADGSYQYSPMSIAINKLSQPDFNDFMDKALTVAGNKFGPALANAARKELDRILAGEMKEPSR